MTTSARSLLAAACMALVFPAVARAQGVTANFGYYDNPTNISAFVPFVDNKPMSVAQKGILSTTLTGVERVLPSELRFCAPAGITKALMVKVVATYIEKIPARMHDPFIELAIEALRRAWPC